MNPINPKHQLLAIFSYVDDVVRAIEKMQAEKFDVETVYSPAPSEEVNEALGIKPSPVRRFVLLGGVTGIVFGLALAVYSAAQWDFIVWGKPPIPRVPYVVVAFEFCILFSILSGLAGLLILTRMPRIQTPAHFDARFTVDRYGLLLNCAPDRIERAQRLLQDSGAEEIRNAAA